MSPSGAEQNEGGGKTLEQGRKPGSGGTPREVPVLTKEEIQSFWSKVDILDENFCWEWAGKLSGGRNKYGAFHVASAKRNVPAHRISYTLVFGDIPDDLVLDHIECDNPPCVNPYHLKPVTHQENITRTASERDCCKNGHPYTADNVYIRKDNGSRSCKVCRKVRRDESRERGNI